MTVSRTGFYEACDSILKMSVCERRLLTGALMFIETTSADVIYRRSSILFSHYDTRALQKSLNINYMLSGLAVNHPERPRLDTATVIGSTNVTLHGSGILIART
jgi:hypothetical protein